MPQSHYHLREQETAARDTIERHHSEVLGPMLQTLFESNPFYGGRWKAAGWDSAPTAGDFYRLPLTTKRELVGDAESHPPYGSNLTYPLHHYVRLHQTSGTSGHPLVVLDTAESWASWKEGWGTILRAAGVQPGDGVFVAFSFGPFVGFWSGFEAAQEIGCRVLTGGGQTSEQRLDAIYRHQPRVLLSTPSYALYLAEAARSRGMEPAASPLEISIHAGEPGASIPSTRARIEAAWGVRCFDHVGASEVGPFGFECHHRPGGVHVNEWDYIFEVLDAGGQPVGDLEEGELVLTNLNRWGFPVVRYRTGDLVRPGPEAVCGCGRSFRVLQGGVIGRVDDMMTIRGVNVFPSSIEAILRDFDEVAEFEGTVTAPRGMDELALRVEIAAGAGCATDDLQQRLEKALRRRLGIRISATIVGPGTLPRWELKAKRFRRE